MVKLTQLVQLNISNLVKESDLLSEHKFIARSVFLLIIAMEEAGRILLINDGKYQANHFAKLEKFSEWVVNTIPDEALVREFVEPLLIANNSIIESYKAAFITHPLVIIKLINLEFLGKQEIRSKLKDSYSQISRIITFIRPKFLYVDINDNVLNFGPFANTSSGLEPIMKFYRDSVTEFLDYFK